MTTRAHPASVPLPPPEATNRQICCEYCPVACGYRVYTWPVGTQGGMAASENALGVDYPVQLLSGRWISENMHTVVEIDGQDHNVVVIPDADIQAVNIGGEHSVRGGALAKKLYTGSGPTADRLQTPYLRVRGDLVPISWEMATDLVANLSRHVIDNYGELAWGMKVYSYQFFQNTFAATKLAFASVGTPNYSPHHAPAEGDDTPGLSDAGIDAFGAAYEDFQEADVLFISGTDPYETKTVAFTRWMVPGGAKIIFVDPRRTFTASYAVANGGMHLQLRPGTDTALYHAIVREIISNGWEDREFIEQYTASRDELDAESGWRRLLFGRTFDELREYLFSRDEFTPEGAEAVTGVSATQIREAAAMLTGNGAAERPKVAVAFEKGLYWSHNYENTAAIANLGIVLGSTGRPGRSIGRLGGHQRGGQSAAGYPTDKSPHDYLGNKIEMDTERWLVEGNTRFRWVVGQNWLGAMGATQSLRQATETLVGVGPTVTSTDPDRAFEQLQARIDAGGMVLVHQETYLNESTSLADIILPAGAWGEDDYVRNNAERRMRLYQKIMDPPGQAKPDWEIFALIAKKMGYGGFDWQDTNEIFEEAAPRSSGSRKDWLALVEHAQAEGRPAHDVLLDFGTTGIQTPIKLEGGQLVGTPRLHADLSFKSDSGKANFVFADWDEVANRNQILGPTGDEVWVLNGRVNELWNNLSDFTRRKIADERWPMNWLEINPDDAASRGIESGDLLSIESDQVLNQVGDTVTGSFTAVAYVSDIVGPGVTFTYFLFPGSPANSVVSADTSLQPINLRYNFKLGKGRIRKIGTTDLGDVMSFAPRNLA